MRGIYIKRIFEWGEKYLMYIACIVADFYNRYHEFMLSSIPTPEEVIKNKERYYLITIKKDSVDKEDMVIKDNEVLIGVGAILMSEGHIMRVLIHPRYRRKGFGKLLLTHLIKVYYRETGGKSLFLWVKRENKAMRSLVEKIGFVREREKDGKVKYVLELP